MPLRLNMREIGFEQKFNALLAMKREVSDDVDSAVRAIIEDVVARGDAALIDLSRKFDRVDLAQAGLRVGGKDIKAAVAACDVDALAALKLAHARIVAFHQRQKP